MDEILKDFMMTSACRKDWKGLQQSTSLFRSFSAGQLRARARNLTKESPTTSSRVGAISRFDIFRTMCVKPDSSIRAGPLMSSVQQHKRRKFDLSMNAAHAFATPEAGHPAGKMKSEETGTIDAKVLPDGMLYYKVRFANGKEKWIREDEYNAK